MARKKPLDFMIIAELLKNARRSDRALAKKLGVSQPTISRRRATMEKELIDGYTAIPRWQKLGYEILAFTFVKTKSLLGPEEAHKVDHEKARKWLMDQPNILYAAGCMGLGWNGFMISVHKSYSDFDTFITRHNGILGPTVDDLGSILVNLDGSHTLKPLHFKYLADELSRTE